MLKKYINTVAVVLLGLILFTSCGNFDNVKIGEPSEVKVKGFEDNYLVVNVHIPVDNPTIHKIKIKNLDVKVFLNNRYIGKLLIDENLVIRPKEKSVKEIPVKVRLNNLLGTAFIMMSLKSGEQAEARFEGEVTAKALLIKKKFKINETRKFKL